MPLLTYDEYRKKEFSNPYVLIIKSGENCLYYFGERHSFDPNDKQWVEQKEFFNSFLKDTEGKKRIVFVEGGVRNLEKTEKEAIVKHGGMGLATFQAHQYGIEVYSPEPGRKLERKELEKEFERDEIQLQYFLGVALQWTKNVSPKPDIGEYHQYYLNQDERNSGWEGYDFSFDHMKELYEKFAQKPFDPEDSQTIMEMLDPYRDHVEVINIASRRSGEIRDEYIVKQIEKYMNDGFSIFAQFGSGHVIVQEPLLKELLV